MREKGKMFARKRRIEILKHYSKGVPRCKCCGEKEMKFLSIDHTKNDGYKFQIKGKRAAGSSLYQLIKKQNFPKGFQVLCFNCNCAKGFYGKCPHVKDMGTNLNKTMSKINNSLEQFLEDKVIDEKDPADDADANYQDYIVNHPNHE